MPTTKSTRRITVAVLLPMTTMAIAATLPLRGNRNSKSKNRRKRKRRNSTCFPNPTIPKRPRTRTLRHPVPGIPPTLTPSSTDRSTAIRCKWWRPLLRAGSVAATISIQIRVAAIPASRRNEGSSTWETTTTTTTTTSKSTIWETFPNRYPRPPTATTTTTTTAISSDPTTTAETNRKRCTAISRVWILLCRRFGNNAREAPPSSPRMPTEVPKKTRRPRRTHPRPSSTPPTFRTSSAFKPPSTPLPPSTACPATSPPSPRSFLPTPRRTSRRGRSEPSSPFRNTPRALERGSPW
mmetsp:Transcript_6988/g.15041  ORF Transcript_6988/g.15041 Transcript_6988/m.15041 type:complete len:295 (-) Transcript_6988:2355-3239(-)